ncbi:WXG100 family type VII secretion target [Amycolatopsis sp. NPDC059657]|uniref:WXG100 family type VII secretion target n=1 Tax=Amycolatopsis sp. NPDC059657 TaxID=3346899 RepID=UPI00366CBEDC
MTATLGLDYLSMLAEQLGVNDPVKDYLNPVVGKWEQLGAEAAKWRTAAAAAGRVSDELATDLGKLDAAWSGKDADAFVVYIEQINIAGTDVEDAMNAMATALDDVAGAVKEIANELNELLVDTAELTSETAMLPVGGDKRARAQLVEAQESAKALYEAARDVLEAFGSFCDGVDGPDAATRTIEISHRYPEKRFKLHDVIDAAAADAEATTASSAAPDAQQQNHDSNDSVAPAAGIAAGAVVGGGMGMMMPPMMGGAMAGGGGGQQHKPKQRQQTKPAELFGEPEQVVPPVIGEAEKPPPAKKNTASPKD